MEVPEVRYARSGGFDIAYQAFGSGPPVVLIPPLVSNVELSWEHELYRRVYEYEAQHIRLIQFDKRGIGGSDGFDEEPTLEQRIDDITAVMDAEGLERASLIGLSEGGLMAQRFAVGHPERVDRLVLINTQCSVADEDLAPFGATYDVGGTLDAFRRLAETWGRDPAYMVGMMMPSQAGNDDFVRWVGRLQRLTASPAAIDRQIRSIVHLFAVPFAASAITAPTLVLHSTRDAVILVSGGRHLAATIPGARLVEFDIEDHFLWVHDRWREVADTFLPFLHDQPLQLAVERRFAALLFTDVVGSTQALTAVGDDRWGVALASHDRITAEVVSATGGRIVNRMGDGLLAVFPAPSAAIEAAVRLRDGLAAVGLTVRAGVHAGEVEVLADGDLRGVGVHLAARVESAAAAGEVLVTSTVRDLVLGGARTFASRGRRALKGIDGEWELFAVER